MKTPGSSDQTLIIVVVLTIITLGGFWAYKYFVTDKKSLNGSTSNNTTSNPSAPVTPKAYVPTKDQLKNTGQNYVSSNQHYKGKWIKPTPNYITEPYIGKTYLKDKVFEIFGLDTKYEYYYGKYYGDMVWFPKSEIEENGPWS